MDKITGVLNALQSIYGKGFILAGFLPICLLLGISWFLGCCLSPVFVEFSEYLLSAKLSQQFAIGTLTLFLISIISFVFWQLNSWFRQVLEGRVLPRFVQDWLSVVERKDCESLEQEIQNYQNEVVSFRSANAQWEAQLLANSTGTGTTLRDTHLSAKFDELAKKTGGWRAVPYQIFEDFNRLLASELAQTSPTAVKKLADIRDGLSGMLVPAGLGMAERELFRRIAKRNSNYPKDQMSIGPSRLANIQEAQRDNLAQSYGIDIAVFWSSLQKIATGDDKFAAILDNSKTRLDFSVALAAVAATFTLGWILLYGLWGSSTIIYVCVSIGAALATVVARQLVLLNYQSFAETVRTTVELFRFELLKSMHISLPLDSAIEKQTWTWLAERLQIGNRIQLPYAQEAPINHA
jgi:hypothetical protein